jgi:hypothetical protein
MKTAWILSGSFLCFRWLEKLFVLKDEVATDHPPFFLRLDSGAQFDTAAIILPLLLPPCGKEEGRGEEPLFPR